MKKIILITTILLTLISENAKSQVYTFDYSTNTNSSCDLFANLMPYQGYIHQTNAGDVLYNSSSNALKLNYDFNNNQTSQKGTEFSIWNLNFKKDYKYVVKITARNTGSYGTPTGLKCNFNQSGLSPNCDGNGFVSNNNNTFNVSSFHNYINSQSFSEYSFETNFLPNQQSILSIATYSIGSISSNALLQTIEIYKIQIFEIPPPPTFTLNPASVSVPCGDLSPRTFTVTSANIPSGASLSYNWSHIGWSVVNSTATSRTLQPNSGTTLPQNVTVTPILNGASKPSVSSVVSRSAFNPIFSITGDTKACPGVTIPMSINAGTNSVVWSVSNPALASISSTTGNNISLTGIANGNVTLNALVTNSCGQQANFPKQILIGAPIPSNNIVSGGQPYMAVGSNSAYQVTPVQGATSYYWFIALNPQCACVTDANGLITCPSGVILPKFSANGSSAYNSPYPTVSIDWGNCAGNYVVNCLAVNNCGQGGVGHSVVTVYNPTSGGTNPNCPENLRIYPNPYNKSSASGSRIVVGNEPCPYTGPIEDNNRISNSQENTIKVYDFQGTFIYEVKFKDDTTDISHLNLKKGKYIVVLHSKKGKQSKEILIVE